VFSGRNNHCKCRVIQHGYLYVVDNSNVHHLETARAVGQGRSFDRSNGLVMLDCCCTGPQTASLPTALVFSR
jgi:hypothetical protein